MSNRKLITDGKKNRHIKFVQGVQIDHRHIKSRRYIIKKLHQIISNPDHPTDAHSLQWRISALRFMEKVLRSEFRNSRDFRRKIDEYLNGFDIRRGPVSQRIKRARKKKGWSQKALATHLGYSTHVSIVQFEQGRRYPTKRIFQWLDEIGM